MTHVSDHAVRIYAERKLGIYADVDGDPQFLVYLTSINIDVEILRRKLSIYGDLGSRFGAPAVIAEGIKVIIKDHTVVTVLAKGMTVGGCSGPPSDILETGVFPMSQQSQVYKHHSHFPKAEWRWPNFTPQELACKGTGELMIDELAMDRLQTLRTLLGKPLVVNSAYRSESHNRNVGGAVHSQHRLAKAFDIRMEGHDPIAFALAARECGFKGFRHYARQGFMHIDIGPARTWYDGGKFPGF